jgi:hypothetical protein
MREVLQQMIADSLAAPVPTYTRRDARLPAVPDLLIQLRIPNPQAIKSPG